MSVWLAFALGGLATYATRVVPLVVTLRGSLSPSLRRYLDALPVAVIAALAGAGVAMPDGRPTGGAEIVAGAAALALARWRKNLLLAVIGGVIVAATARGVGL
ncbi:MAG: AzlD domain-containing protein [Chloroflexi bacterium]|nr:MAG: AzlD domain-containing protein [Chloroflexota bacterium]TMB73026.1 MAG: AzlD domain-containing protein [Chloroflexota bacterium]TMB97335.1 MAG: AzlD domain-containing protein [Chloroflexota bacterium]TMC28979.1 MAG: AzlD domain-containing protein [Chloroflexota bacterium]TMC35527.1 MAG: AzlD domain-containing protein [Chloroflexota bacterium]